MLAVGWEQFEAVWHREFAKLLDRAPDHVAQGHVAPCSQRPIVLPSSRLLAWWADVAAAGAVFYAVSVPLRIAFSARMTGGAWWALDYSVDALFVLDMVLRACTAHVDARGLTVVAPAAVLRHYMQTRFFLDLLSCLPLDVFARLGGGPGPSTHAAAAGGGGPRVLEPTEFHT